MPRFSSLKSPITYTKDMRRQSVLMRWLCAAALSACSCAAQTSTGSRRDARTISERKEWQILAAYDDHINFLLTSTSLLLEGRQNGC